MEEVNHFIEKEILRVLMRTDKARFKEMRPERVDSNLYAYHLNKLLKMGFVDKFEDGYKLAARGVAYADKVSLVTGKITVQPKINTGIVLKNNNGEILLEQRDRQPWLGYWGLPMGKLHIEDESVLVAAKRELAEKTGVSGVDLVGVGDCYLRYYMDEVLVSATLVHIFTGVMNVGEVGEDCQWRMVERLGEANVIPGVKKICQLMKENQGRRFFAEIKL